jgi:hypothetical protein
MMNDLEKGLLASTSALGRAVKAAEDGDEIEFEQENGRRRKVLIESIEKGLPAGGMFVSNQKEEMTPASFI